MVITDDEIIDVEPLEVEEPWPGEPVPSTSAAADAAVAAAASAFSTSTTVVAATDNSDTAVTTDVHDQLSTDLLNIQSEQTDRLDDEILRILGDDPSTHKSYGEDIHKDLTVRFEHVATNGLTKEARQELQDKYLPPSNCTLIDGPDLNPEIKAAISETVVKRDKSIEIKQKQIANAISCIGKAMIQLLSIEGKNTILIKFLMDASRILCDCQYLDSVTRRNFILGTIKKDMKDQLQTTKIDRFLFGKDLGETLKTAKAISKSGADLKFNSSAKPSQATGKKTNSLPAKNLNWKAPPPGRRPPRNQRNQQPASQRGRRTPSFRTSQPQAPQHRSHR